MTEHTLTVAAVEQLTPDSKAFYFEANSVLDAAKAGQFLTVIVDISGSEQRRSYSLCTDANSPMGIGVKCVKGGVVSNYLNSNIRAGSKLKVSGPAGQFTYVPEKNSYTHLLLLAGGSGITPMLAILRTALLQAPNTKISMLYVNKSREDIMFAEPIRRLAEENSDRFQLVHYLDAENASSRQVKKAGIKGLLGGKETVVDPGFINAERAKAIFDGFDCSPEHTGAFICGPGGFMNLMQETLVAFNFPKSNIKQENFVPSTAVRAKPDFEPVACDAVMTVDGQAHSFHIKSGQSVLQAALEADIVVPFSCREGTCTACYGRCLSGEVGMLTDESLSDDEIALGGYLPCVAYPKSKKLQLAVGD